MKRLTFVAIAAALSMSAMAAGKHKQADKPAKPAKPEFSALSSEQINTAGRVLTGQSKCEFDQSVHVAAVPNQKGWFNVEYKGKSYLMAPETTTTGAVRLEDKRAGMMWLQIANKSMLMNSKIGQRMVDNCVHPGQRA
jgi:hypothetical protein